MFTVKPRPRLRFLTAQTFPPAGAKGEITFSACTRDRFGRLPGCKAGLQQIPAEIP